MIDRSSARLVYRLHTRDGKGSSEALSLALAPGALVFFNGDLLHHKVSPLGSGEERIALTLEYLTAGDMNHFLRFVSNMKDAVAYFGFRQVFVSRENELESISDSRRTTLPAVQPSMNEAKPGKEKERAARKDPPVERDEPNRERVRERLEKAAEPRDQGPRKKS